MNYRRKSLRNKIGNIHKARTSFRRFLLWSLLALLVVAGGIAAYLVFFSETFKISHMQITGNAKTQTADMEGFLTAEMTSRLFLFNTAAAQEKLQQQFPIIKEVTIEKDFPSTLVMSVQERQPAAVFCNDALCYLIDSEGVAYETVQESGEVMRITREGNPQVVVGKAIIESSLMDSLAKIQKNLYENLQINIKEAFISNPLILKTSEDWKIYFAPQDIDGQIAKMNALLSNEISAGERKRLQYIYLQYKDRSYYK